MLQLKNNSPFAPAIALLPDATGIDTLFVIVRGCFDIGPRLRVADEQLPPPFADEYWAEPGKSSLKHASELHLGKPTTDVILTGHAWAPAGQRTVESAVAVQVAERKKLIRVFGRRVWTHGGMSRPEPFERIPLTYEHAYGGTYVDQGTGETQAEDTNPVGLGFLGKRPTSQLSGQPVPNLEDPARPLSKPGDVSMPAATGFVAASWLPRRQFVGTYDASWQKKRAPYLPADFSPRFFSCACPELTFERYLTGGEPVTVLGASERGPLRFDLPTCQLTVHIRLAGQLETPPARLETVHIEPDANRLSLTWRAQLGCDKRALKVEEISVDAPSVQLGAGARA